MFWDICYVMIQWNCKWNSNKGSEDDAFACLYLCKYTWIYKINIGI